MRYLAVDFGRSRLGLAVSDPEGRIATPYAARRREGTRRDVADLLRTISGLGVEGIVFGMPYSLDESAPETDSARLARNFAAVLEEALRAAQMPQQIEWWDERFSTTQALSQLKELGISQRVSRESTGADSVDAQAAANILQGFLDCRKEEN